MKYLILSLLLLTSSTFAQNQYPYLEDMPEEQICFNVGYLALLMSEIYIYQGREPNIVNKVRAPSEFEMMVLEETKRRVEELIQGESKLDKPKLIEQIVRIECTENIVKIMKGRII